MRCVSSNRILLAPLCRNTMLPALSRQATIGPFSLRTPDTERAGGLALTMRNFSLTSSRSALAPGVLAGCKVGSSNSDSSWRVTSSRSCSSWGLFSLACLPLASRFLCSRSNMGACSEYEVTIRGWVNQAAGRSAEPHAAQIERRHAKWRRMQI